MTATLKPWPADAVIIVAATAGTEDQAAMRGVHVAQCRDCRAEVHGDAFTFKRAHTFKSRRGRPVEYLCCRCAMGYDAGRSHS